MPRGQKNLEDSNSTETKSKSKMKPNPLPPLSTTTTSSTTDSPQRQDAAFTEEDFKSLAKNEHGRYLPNSRKVGHAVIREEQGRIVAEQYPLPVIEGGEIVKEDSTPFTTIVPEVRPLINIEAIEPFHGMHRYRAETPDNHTEMFAKRSVKGKIGNSVQQDSSELEIACFSPNPKKNALPFFGSLKPTPVLKETISTEAKKDIQEMGKTVKGGHHLPID
jgi:hypothetical protein